MLLPVATASNLKLRLINLFLFKTSITAAPAPAPFKTGRLIVGGYYGLALIIIALAFSLPTAPAVKADTNSFVVTSELDNGWDANPPPNSLRAAIVAANAFSSTLPYTITFNFAAPTTTITLQGSLPKIVVKTVITGPTNQQITISGAGQFQPFYVEGANGQHGQLTISNLTIAHGKAFDYGGAIFNHQNTATLNNMTFYDNQAPFRGGAVMSDLGTLLINNSTFYSNSVTAAEGPFGGDGGGAIYIHPYWPVASSQITVANSTFYSNAVLPRSVAEGGGSGGAILNAVSTYRGTPVQGRLYLKDSVVAHNFADYGTGPDISSNNYFTSTTGLYTTGGYNFIGDGSDVGGDLNGTPPQDGVNGDHVGTHANPLNPRLGAFQNNGGPAFSLAPLPGSPLIDAANPGGCKDAAKGGGTPVLLTTDGRLFPRSSDSLGTGTARCDIGAFEVQAPRLAFSNPNLSLTLGNAPVLFEGAGGSVSDLDNSGFSGGSLTVNLTGNGAAGDVLGLNNQGNGQGQVGVNGNIVSYGGTPVGTLSSAGGANATLTLTFTGSGGSGSGGSGSGVTTAMVQSIVNNLSFGASQVGPGQRNLTLLLNDSSGGKSRPVQLLITITTLTLTSTPNPAAYNQNIVFTATFSPIAATGTVTFSTTPTGTVLGTASLVNGVATFTVTAGTLPQGTTTVQAVYSGDATYTGSTSNTINQQVTALTSTLSLTSGPDPSSFVQDVVFTATVSPIAASGTVTFSTTPTGTVLGTAQLSNGVAVITVMAGTLPIGSTQVQATYGGDTTHSGSTSNIVTQVVTTVPTTLTLASDPNPSTYGQSVVFTATLSPLTASGPVTLSTVPTGTILGATNLVSGTAVFTVSTLPIGLTNLKAAYGGNANYLGSQSNQVAQMVNSPILNCDPYLVTSATDDGSGLTCGTLSFAISRAVTATTDVSITFTSTVTAITIGSKLPDIHNTNGHTVSLDGGCTPDGNGNGRGGPGVQLIGSNSITVGLTLAGNANLSGVKLTGFGGYGLAIGGSGNSLSCSWIGTANGTTASPNAGGVHFLPGATNNRLGQSGASATSKGNLIGGNTGSGIVSEGGPGNSLYANWIGLGQDGLSHLRNGGPAVQVSPTAGRLVFGPGNRLNAAP